MKYLQYERGHVPLRYKRLRNIKMGILGLSVVLAILLYFILQLKK